MTTAKRGAINRSEPSPTAGYAPFRTFATRAARSIELVESGPSHSLRFVQLVTFAEADREVAEGRKAGL
jgi:hypothetical protein